MHMHIHKHMYMYTHICNMDLLAAGLDGFSLRADQRSAHLRRAAGRPTSSIGRRPLCNGATVNGWVSQSQISLSQAFICWMAH